MKNFDIRFAFARFPKSIRELRITVLLHSIHDNTHLFRLPFLNKLKLLSDLFCLKENVVIKCQGIANGVQMFALPTIFLRYLRHFDMSRTLPTRS